MIVVCLAPADLRPAVDGLSGTVTVDPRRADLTAAESAAVEHGLRIAEAWNEELLAVASGPAAIEPLLVEVRALGAAVLRVDTHQPEPAGAPVPASGAELAGDPSAIAGQLAAAILSQGQPDLVICGDRSSAHGVGAVPGFLADRLGVDAALGLVSISVTGPRSLIVERRLDGGWRERLSVNGPAVLSVEAAGVRLRRAALPAVLASAERPVPLYTAGPSAAPPLSPPLLVHAGAPVPYRPRTQPVPAPEGDHRRRLLALTGALSERQPPTVVGPLPAGEAADVLLAYLARHGYRSIDG